MYLVTEVIFFSGKRENSPQEGYHPDAIFNISGR